jgi:DNA-binding SARP family transcriptional activator/tetratricopeptide (TPR) repeat protein
VTVEIKLLGTFEVVFDGRPVAADAWPRRQAASLVKVLALSPGRRRHREQVIDLLWPDLSVAEAAPRLHKLAHYARLAMGGDRRAVVLRGDIVALLPDTDVVVDVDTFDTLADAAVSAGTSAAAADAVTTYGGTLLPGDQYEPWTEDRREQLRLRFVDMLRRAELWDRLLTEDPADEEATLALVSRHLASGDNRAALRQFERLDAALRQELGMAPSRRVLAMRDELLTSISAEASPGLPRALVGRQAEERTLAALLTEAGRSRGRTVLLSGPAGVGKTVLLDWTRTRAEQAGWRTGRGAAAAVEGAWPYAPVLDALSDLCRQHPTLLDGLDETLRAEIERALAGHELTWSGEGTHQRLFVAAAEVLRLAAAGSGLLLTVDDMHEADDASLRLLHYLARCAASERTLIVVGYRSGTRPVERFTASLLRRTIAVPITLHTLDRSSCDVLARTEAVDASAEALDQIWAVSGGLPFAVVELARGVKDGVVTGSASRLGLDRLSVVTREALQQVAVIGTSFDTDEFVAMTGLPEPEAYAALDSAVAAAVVVHTGSGFRFRHALIRDALLDDIPPAKQRALHQEAASRLIAMGAAPARIAHHVIASGRPSEAVGYVLSAVETQAAVGAYRDALNMVDAVRGHAEGGDRAQLLALRADLLSALGDRSAIPAYRAALAIAAEPDRRLLRARMGHAAVREGDLETADAVLDGLKPDGGPVDAAILLAQGNLAYLRGDTEAAASVVAQVGHIVRPDGNTWQQLDLLTLQALIAHHRGELFSRLRMELRRAQDTPALASTLFDPYLCVVEFLLYGSMPYDEVKALALSLRETGRRSGILRAEALATAWLGEAALLTGNLNEAERELQDAVDLHREIGASAGEASSLQRLAELRLLQGDRDEATRLLHQALLLARWSIMSLHLMQRIFGTLILAAPDPQAARMVVEQANETMVLEDRCTFCDIMFAVPAAIACAGVNDLDDANRYLAAAERSEHLWEGTSWQGAILEAHAHVSIAEGDGARAAAQLDEAALLFERAGQPLDAARCRAGLTGTSTSTSSFRHGHRRA